MVHGYSIRAQFVFIETNRFSSSFCKKNQNFISIKRKREASIGIAYVQAFADTGSSESIIMCVCLQAQIGMMVFGPTSITQTHKYGGICVFVCVEL